MATSDEKSRLSVSREEWVCRRAFGYVSIHKRTTGKWVKQNEKVKCKQRVGTIRTLKVFAEQHLRQGTIKLLGMRLVPAGVWRHTVLGFNLHGGIEAKTTNCASIRKETQHILEHLPGSE